MEVCIHDKAESNSSLEAQKHQVILKMTKMTSGKEKPVKQLLLPDEDFEVLVIVCQIRCDIKIRHFHLLGEFLKSDCHSGMISIERVVLFSTFTSSPCSGSLQ